MAQSMATSPTFVDMIRRNNEKMAESIAGFRHEKNENIAYIFMTYQAIAPLV